MINQPTDRIVVEFTQGDPRAFTIIYNKYYSALYLFAKSLLTTEQDAEDIVGDVFLKLWSSRANFDTIENIKAYLFAMTRNACLDLLRRLMMRSKVQQELIYQLETRAEDAFARMEIKAEVMEYVSQELKKLSPKYRTIFKLSFIDGLKNEEIASHLQISNKGVRDIKSYIRKILKVSLLDKHLFFTVLFFWHREH